MEKFINDIILHRFFNRETTEQENKDILQWVGASEENRAEFRKAHQLHHLSNLKQSYSEMDVDKAWKELSSNLPKERKSQRIVYLNIIRKYAVSILILLTVGFGSLWTKEHYINKTKSAVIQFEAPKGEKSKVLLADGSMVWLNSQTKLRYNTSTPRKVSIDGEVYFEVKKDPKHPFEVTTNTGIVVKVTGTKFNLRSYSDDQFVETTLDEGQVIITKDHHEIATLNPGQQAKYDIRKNELYVNNVSTKIYSLWKNNELRVFNISFAELAPQIERWYGVSIKLDPQIGYEDQFTMTIKTESIRELLEMMKLTSKFDYEINGEQVEISAK